MQRFEYEDVFISHSLKRSVIYEIFDRSLPRPYDVIAVAYTPRVAEKICEALNNTEGQCERGDAERVECTDAQGS